VFIFLVDISREAWQCKMLSYMVTVLKEVFSREEMNETQIYFYTYDEAIHEYDFSGEEVERTILDPTIKQYSRSNDNFLVDIRVYIKTSRINYWPCWIRWRMWRKRTLGTAATSILSLNTYTRASGTLAARCSSSRRVRPSLGKASPTKT
jgi:hypothetical protein